MVATASVWPSLEASTIGPSASAAASAATAEPTIAPSSQRATGKAPILVRRSSDQRRVGERIEGEVAAVGGRGDRHRGLPGKHRRVIDFSAGVEQQADAEQCPGKPLAADQRGPQQAGGGARQHQGVVDPGVEKRVGAGAAESDRGVRGEGGEQAEGQEAAGKDGPSLALTQSRYHSPTIGPWGGNLDR